MNVEYITKDGEKGRYTGVSHFQQDLDGVGFFNSDERGFVLADSFVTYAGAGHTGNVSAANEEPLEAVIADLRREEQTTDEMLIVGSGAHVKQGSSGIREADGISNDENQNH